MQYMQERSEEGIKMAACAGEVCGEYDGENMKEVWEG